MKILRELNDVVVGQGKEIEQLKAQYQLRKSARAILINEDGLVATQYVSTYTFHKLPGGGVDAGESIPEALRREVREEVGCDCEVLDPVGVVIEYRNKYHLLHISYCYVAKVVGPIMEPTLEPGEIEEGQETKWVTPENLEQLMVADTPLKYEGHYIRERELAFLREYLERISHTTTQDINT